MGFTKSANERRELLLCKQILWEFSIYYKYLVSIRVNRHTPKWCEAMNIQKGNQDIGLFIVNGVLFCNENNGIDVTNKHGNTGVKLSREITQKFDFCQLSKILTVYNLINLILLPGVKNCISFNFKYF